MVTRRHFLELMVGGAAYYALSSACGPGGKEHASPIADPTASAATNPTQANTATSVRPTATPAPPKAPTAGLEGVFDYQDGVHVRVYFPEGSQSLITDYTLVAGLDEVYGRLESITGWIPPLGPFNRLAYAPTDENQSNQNLGNPLLLAKRNYIGSPGWYEFIHETAHGFTWLTLTMAKQAIFREGMPDSLTYWVMRDILSAPEKSALSQKGVESLSSQFATFDKSVDEMRAKIHANGANLTALNGQQSVPLDAYRLLPAILKDLAADSGWRPIGDFFKTTTSVQPTVYSHPDIFSSPENSQSAFFGVLGKQLGTDIRPYLASVGISLTPTYDQVFLE